MSDSKDKPSAEPSADTVILSPALAGHPLLSLLSGSMTPDHWHWLYRALDGSLLAESDRRNDDLPLLGRFYVEGSVIIVWEPAG
jgi:hypothetical protein